MKIAAIQLKPVTGDIGANIKRHLKFIELAIINGADLVFFPELSITGYEPRLAKSLAQSPDSSVFEIFQEISDLSKCIISLGIPIISNEGVQISMIWFQPNKERTTYAKQLLHPNEELFFVSGGKSLTIKVNQQIISPAICFESLQSIHAKNAANEGSSIYLASVAKSQSGIQKAKQHYPKIASNHDMIVVMANCIGVCDDFVASGQSAAWDSQGKLIANMGEKTYFFIYSYLNNSQF